MDNSDTRTTSQDDAPTGPHNQPFALDATAFPYIPAPSILWRSLKFLVWAVLAVFVIDDLADLLVRYWLINSLGNDFIFWTNFKAQLLLCAVLGISFALAVFLPLRAYAASEELKRAAVHLGLWALIIAGSIYAEEYRSWLLATHGVPFGQQDPVFGYDYGFYLFRLPFYLLILEAAAAIALTALIATFVGRFDALQASTIRNHPEATFAGKLALFFPRGTGVIVIILGALLALRLLFSRFELLLKENEASGVRVGAEYIDVVGPISTLNSIYLSAIIVFIGAIIVARLLRSQFAVHAHLEDPSVERVANPNLRRSLLLISALALLDILFYLGIVARDVLFVSPNEPHIQETYIKRHMDATLKGYGLDKVTQVSWEIPQEALPAHKILSSVTIQKAPILPGFVTYLEEKSPDAQQAGRYGLTRSNMVYGPVLEVYDQQQRLRPYYQIIDVDASRYTIDGEKRMYVSALREVPSARVVGPQDWLVHWGSSTLLYTHGMGMNMSPADRVNEHGEPLFTIEGIPPTTTVDEFVTEPRIYYGEGGQDAYIITNINHLKEFDYATEQSRMEYVLPENVEAGIKLDSFFKRMVFAIWTIRARGNDVAALLFSGYVDSSKSRIHVYRTPLERAHALAPFLFLDDSNLHAFAAEGRIKWMVNALTTSRWLPYSLQLELGDKAQDRAPDNRQFPTRWSNYAEDSIKIVIDANTGAVTFFKISDQPIVSTWSAIYPGFFKDRSEMPDSVANQLTYPLKFFHTQFDDVYKRYHQRNYLEFYNLEDLWDDADEVLGSIGVGTTPFGNSDEATFSYEGYHVLLSPRDLPPGTGIEAAEGEDSVYAMLMPFTPQNTRNLRSLIVVCQDPHNYGKLVSMQIPQGQYVMGPEQADSIIDADSQVNQQLTLWIRHGAEVMAGHTLLLPVNGDIFYIEPIFVKSVQNNVPQIKLFATVYRDRVTMAPTLEEAIKLHDTPLP